MKTHPSIPQIKNAPDGLFDGGHLWVLEKIDGAQFRVQLQESGRLRFGGRTHVYNDATDVPAPYQHAVRHVQERFDRQALRKAVDDVETIVFFGEATHKQTLDYDWATIPSFLGFDIWSATDERFVQPDTAEQIFERIGLSPVPAVERELPARDFDHKEYTVPQSAWYDGPAAGVVIRDKRGHCALQYHPDFEADTEPKPADDSTTALTERYATDQRFERVAASITENGQSVTFERLYERMLEDITREAHKHLYQARTDIEMGEFRDEVAARTRTFLDTEIQ
ncbi:RNA ligase family protein [Halovenus rubra]|uniref:RNA ligase family protein n=2 Tax=Halovenus rubra TaxID=869890 RepID=A0ABD5X3G5_9EURY|nr:RNA ligase family protein [Halovenus rubra]